MRKFLLLLILTAIVTGCRTRKVDVQIAEQEESASVQLQRESALKKNLELIKQMVDESRVSSFNQALSLTPVLDGSGVAQPVSYVENRNGKPFREIYITGGSLSENKQERDSSGSYITQLQQKEIVGLKMKLDSVVATRAESLVKEKGVKVFGGQFGIYVLGGIVILVLILIGYVEYRIRQFNKALK